MPYRAIRYNCTKHAVMDAILQLPDPPSGPKNLFPWLLGVLPADNPQLTALSRNCPCLKRAASSKVIQPASNNWLIDVRVWSSDSLTSILKDHPSSRALVEFAEHLFGMLPQTSLSLCPILTPFLPPKVLILRALLRKLCPCYLYLRICFVRNPTSKSRRYWTTAMQFYCE